MGAALSNIAQNGREASHAHLALAGMSLEQKLLNHGNALKHNSVVAVNGLLVIFEPVAASAELLLSHLIFILLEGLLDACDFLGIRHLRTQQDDVSHQGAPVDETSVLGVKIAKHLVNLGKAERVP